MRTLDAVLKIISLLFMTTLIGCDRILTTLIVDRSASNVNDAENRENVIGICKSVVSKLTDADTLTIKEFDSQPKPSTLDYSLENPNAKKRREFMGKKCLNILPNQAATGVSPGTDIDGVWMKFYAEYDQRRKSKNNDTQGDTSEVIIFYLDALEPVSQEKEKTPISDDFKTSMKKFIRDKNFIVIFVAKQTDREVLGRELDSVTDLERRLIIVDPKPNKSYEQVIESIYSKARMKDSK